MTKYNSIKIASIDAKSPYLSAVIDLWSSHRSTLGFFPKDAFVERANKRQILVAINPEGECIGYLLYRNSYDRITIVHLCISQSYRRQGIPDLLLQELKRITVEKYTGICLSCRHDYGLQSMWSRLGFVYKYDKPGKNKAGKPLGFWWLDHGHTNLLSSVTIQELESKLCVIIDIDIYINLYQDNHEENDYTELLLSDWIAAELELCITEVIFNYISLISDDKERNLQTELAKKRFTCLPCQNQILDTVKAKLHKIISTKTIFIDDIQLQHLARAITSDSHLFITNCKNLLAIAHEVYENFQLSILTPHELINQLDELRNKPDYQPVRLAGSPLTKIAVQRGQEKELTKHFVFDSSKETTSAFRQSLSRFISEIDKFETYVVLNKEELPIALFVYSKSKSNELEIPLLRFGKNPLSATLARHIIFKSILLSANKGKQFTRITDQNLDEIIINAIQEDNFIRVNNGWLKINLPLAEKKSYLSKILYDLGISLPNEYSFCLKIADALNSDLVLNDIQTAHVEKFLFPAKIIDSQINNFIIPIQPRWAQDLFDEHLAQQTLFGLLELENQKIGLAFNREAVYYRTVKNSAGLNAPSRILWYVSHNNSYYDVGCIRACSLIDEVIIGKPKELYQRFKRLGVYKLDNIMNISQDKNGDIMAIRFSNTELLKYPIRLKKVQEVLGNKTTVPSPIKIQNNHFVKLYTLASKKY